MRLNRRWRGEACRSGRLIGALALLVAIAMVALRFPAKLTSRPANARNNLARVSGVRPSAPSLAHLPFVFEVNQGQTDRKVKFLARGNGYALFLTSDAAVLAFRRSNPDSTSSDRVLPMELVHSNPRTEIKGSDPLPGKSNYLIGKDPAQWHHHIPQFARVRYAEVYPGIDLIYYGNQGRLEYDFEVAPGGDPDLVQLRFRTPEPLAIAANGDLLIKIAGGEVRLEAPRVYQRIGDQQHPVEGRFQLRGPHQAGFLLGSYDHRRTLVIDPVLTYSTYLGGSGTEACSIILGKGVPVSQCPAVAVDDASNAYIAGPTTSIDFPLGPSPFQSNRKGPVNVFVTKFNNVANTIEFSTYLGGNGTDYTGGIGVDSATNVLVGGTTSSTDFPTTTSNYCQSLSSKFKSSCMLAFQTSALNAKQHGFVSKLDPTGEALLYSTYLSGNGTEIVTGFTVGLSDQNAYVTGTTTSTNTPSASSIFPATLGAYQTVPLGLTQFFMSKIVPNLSGASSLAYSTYFGGGNPLNGLAIGGGIAVDVNNNVYITGGTNFLNVGTARDFPILNAYQGCLDAITTSSTTACPTNVTATDAFAAEFNPNAVTGSQLLYSTYLGGTGDDIGYGIATDGTNAYVTGSTASSDFPVTGTGVYQSTYGGGPTDAFLAKLANPVSTTGTSGGGTGTSGSSGSSGSGGTSGGSSGSQTQGLVTLAYSTFLGGLATDVGLAVGVDSNQGARLTGWSNSPNIPELNNNIQAGYAGGNDAFVARIDTTGTSSTAPGHYFTYLGGTGADYGTGIAVDQQEASYVAGETSSADFLQLAIPQNQPYQTTLNGVGDAFLSKLGPTLSLTMTGTSSPPSVGVGNQVSFMYTITNTGDLANNIIFSDVLPTSAGASFTSATVTSGTCGSATGGIVSCTIGTLNSGANATATVILTPTASIIPSLTALSLGNTASVTVVGCTACTQSITLSTVVNDFNLSVSPTSATVPAGVPATYTTTITPTGNIPNSVSLSCTSGLPTGATCTEAPAGPIQNLSSGAVSVVLAINTTTRVTTTTDLGKHGPPWYATWLAFPGLALLGLGMRKSGPSRYRLLGFLLLSSLSMIFFQVGCTKSSVTTTSGTPAGTYIVTVAASSGTATRNATVTLVVQ